MLLTLVIALAVSLLGLAVFLWASSPRRWAGLVAFGCGLLIFLSEVSGFVSVQVHEAPPAARVR